MTFTPVWTPEASDVYYDLRDKAEAALKARRLSKKKKSSKQEGLFKQVKKCIDLLLENPRHPSLHTHEFSSLQHPYDINEKVFEAYAQHGTHSAYRVFWGYGPEKGHLTIIAITPHP
jgi:hypothetical protein